MSDLNDKLRNKAFEKWHKLRRHLDRMDARLAWDAGYEAARATPAPQAAPSDKQLQALVGLSRNDPVVHAFLTLMNRDGLGWIDVLARMALHLANDKATLTKKVVDDYACRPAAPAKESATSGEQFDWLKAERIRDEDHVDEALRAFREDPTGDNATGIIQAALTVWTADVRAAPSAASSDARDTKRLDFMVRHEAWIAWGKDGESCRVFHRNEEGDAVPMLGWGARHWRHDPREAIDAALSAPSAGEAE